MKAFLHPVFALSLLFALSANAQKPFEYSINTSGGELGVAVLGHASLLFQWDNQTIYVDPYSKVCDYAGMAKADIILITHEHFDHFEAKAINQIKTDSTLMIYTSTCKASAIYSGMDTVMANGDSIHVKGIAFNTVAAYNFVKTRHVKGVGNGYIITFGDKRIYVAGDTEIITEMETIKNIDIAFLGYSTYNMDATMFFDAVSLIQPDVVIPYHYDNSDISQLIGAVDNIAGVTMLTGMPATSVFQLNENRDNALYPNPASNVLYGNAFELGSLVSVFSSNGQLVCSYTINNEGKVDVSKLASGLYFLTSTGNGKTITSRFVIER